MPAPRRPARGRRKVKKNIPIGQAHIKTSFNNTIVSLTDQQGNVIAWESAGGAGFKGSRKSTPFAAPVTADAAARRSREAGGDLAEAHSSLGTVKVWLDWDWPGAEAAFRRALELNPSYVQAHRYYACLLSHTGRHVEAAAEMDTARALDPLSPIMHALSGHLRWHARDYQRALAHLRDADAINSNLWIVHAFLGRVYESTDRMDEALSEYQKAFDLSGGGNTEPIAFRARVQALIGNEAAAQQGIRTLVKLSESKYVPPYNIAIVYAGLGDTENALRWLEKGFEVRDVRLGFLVADPRGDGIRGEARFQELCRRLSLPDSRVAGMG